MSSEGPPVNREELLDRQSRKVLLDRIAADYKDLRGQLVYNRPDLIPCARLLAIANKLIDPQTLEPMQELESAEKGHLKKMLAIERRDTPRVSKAPKDERFWRAVERSIEPEWLQVVMFEEDLSYVPKNWQAARNDLLSLRNSLIENKQK